MSELSQYVLNVLRVALTGINQKLQLQGDSEILSNFPNVIVVTLLIAEVRLISYFKDEFYLFVLM